MKKVILLASLVTSVFFVIADYLGTSTFCGGTGNTSCMQNMHSFLLVLMPVVPFFVLLIVVYSKESIYSSWIKFAAWAIPIAMVLVAVTPEYPEGMIDPIQKGSVALLVSAIFTIVSLVIIAKSYFTKRS